VLLAPQIEDLNFLNAEEKNLLHFVTHAVLQTLGINASHNLTGDKEEFLAEIPQILLPARDCEVPLQSRAGRRTFLIPNVMSN